MNNHPTPKNNSRIGFHYFPDTLHYRESDLQAWLPELKSMGASWLTLVAPENRAIPESFIRGLINANIEPILHFHLSTGKSHSAREMSLLFKSYKSWGVNYIALFNRPNCHSEWQGSSWARQDLVERFLDSFLPLAEAVYGEGLIPIFPPLEPGGDYWDTAFLRSALVGIQRRGHGLLLEKLCLSAYSWADNLPFNWGAGGPERWPGARPYFTPPGEEDHIAFRIFDWYAAIGRAVLGETPPIFILGGGSRIGDQQSKSHPEINKVEHQERNIKIARLMSKEIESQADGKYLEPVPDFVFAYNFYFLASNEDFKNSNCSWYLSDGSKLPIVDELKTWQLKISGTKNNSTSKVFTDNVIRKSESKSFRPIKHYVLIPSYEWGVSDWHLDVTRDFIKKHKATIGFSVEEASNAERVTLIGGENTFSENVLSQLHAAGCKVEQINGDGTEIASKLERL